MSDFQSIKLEKFQQLFIDSVPHHRILDLRVTAFSLGRVAYTMPYAQSLIGDPATGEIHDSAIVALMDAVCAAAVQTQLGKTHRTATLDLRTDFVRQSRAGQDIIGEAEYLRHDTHTALVRAIAHDGDPADPIMVATGSFAVLGIPPAKAAA
jgi:uncharacterized protein (TIGR00369 family)